MIVKGTIKRDENQSVSSSVCSGGHIVRTLLVLGDGTERKGEEGGSEFEVSFAHPL